MPVGTSESELQEAKEEDRAPHVLFARGVTALSKKQIAEAVTLFEEAISIRRARPLYHFKLGQAQQAAGNAEQAAEAFENSLRLNPGLWQARLSLGFVRLEQGKRKEARRSFLKLLRHAAAGIAERIWLAPRVLWARLSTAVRHGRLGRQAVSARVLHRIGSICEARGRLEKATARYSAALKTDPDCVEALNSLGRVLIKARYFQEAVRHLERARGLEPDNPETLAYLGLALAWLARRDEAGPLIDEALTLRPGWSETLCAKGWFFNLEGNPEAAANSFRDALAKAPDMIDAHLGLGKSLQDLGRLEEAAQRMTQILSIDRVNGDALVHLSRIRKFSASDPEFVSLRRALAPGHRPAIERMQLHYAAGKMNDDTDAVDKAFEHYRLANDLFDVVFDPKAHKAHIDALIETFSPAFFEATKGFGDSSEMPVFIVGMPRSGTTLVEQILASHPLAYGAGELDDIVLLKDRLGDVTAAGTPYPDCVSHVGRETAESLARPYLEKLRRFSPDAIRVMDKMPGNFLNLGLIALILQRARVIHCLRDPLDTCFSIYVTPLRAGHPYACSLTNLGFYYCEYQRLMDHWRQALPLRLLDVTYEDLVADQEGVSRQIVEFCGLEWDERCLAFYDTQRVVQSASNVQVRRPISTASIGRWRRYGEYLGPLKDALGMGAG